MPENKDNIRWNSAILCKYTRELNIQPEPHIHLFSEDSREHWVWIGEQVVCGLVYSYILGIRYYAPNTFSVLPNLPNRRILANTVCESQFSRLLVNLWENARELTNIRYLPILGELTYAHFRLNIISTSLEYAYVWCRLYIDLNHVILKNASHFFKCFISQLDLSIFYNINSFYKVPLNFVQIFHEIFLQVSLKPFLYSHEFLSNLSQTIILTWAKTNLKHQSEKETAKNFIYKL